MTPIRTRTTHFHLKMLIYWVRVLTSLSLSTDAISTTIYKNGSSCTPHTTPERKRQWWSTPSPRGSNSSTSRSVVQNAWCVLRTWSATVYSWTTLCLPQRGSKQVSSKNAWMNIIEKSDVQVWIQTGFRHFTEIGQCLNDSKLWEIHGILCKLIFGGACLLFNPPKGWTI